MDSLDSPPLSLSGRCAMAGAGNAADTRGTDQTVLELHLTAALRALDDAGLAFQPFWTDRVPYVVATIELEEGICMLSEMPDLAPKTVAIGLPVTVDFEPIEGVLRLPFFRVVSDA